MLLAHLGHGEGRSGARGQLAGLYIICPAWTRDMAILILLSVNRLPPKGRMQQTARA